MAKRDRILEDLTPEQRKALKGPPLGNNTLGAYAIFFQREKYANQTYPKVVVPTPMDLWYDKEKSFYGRVDQFGNPLILDESYLKQLTSPSNQNSWVLDFVADAFNDFKKEYLLLNKTATQGTPFEFLTPKECWRSAPAAYDEFLSSVFAQFSTDYMVSFNRDQTLLTFDSFLTHFREFIRLENAQFPITFSQYILSKYSSPLSSGLMIELSNDSHADDFEKYENFIKNINFDCYARTARKYGFKIDKNYPGRMIADVKSPAMRKYFEKYPIPAKPFTETVPSEPLYTPPPLPDPNEPSPWKVGDLVEITVIIPDDRSGSQPYFILNAYTLPKNTVFPIGMKSKIYEDASGIQHDEYDFLLDYFDGYGKPVKYILEVTNPTPQQLIRQNTSVGGTNTTPANQASPTASGGTSPSSAPAQSTQLGSALQNAQTLSQETSQVELEDQFFDSVSNAAIFGPATAFIEAEIKSVSANFPGASLSDALPAFEDQFFYAFGIPEYEIFSSGGSPVYRKYSWQRDLATSTFNMQIPLKAVHLSAIGSTDTTTIERINNYYNYDKAVSDYEFSKRVYDTSIWPGVVARHEQDLAQYELEVKRYNQELIKASRPPLTFDNFPTERYNHAYDYDIEMLIEFCMQLYYSYVSASPSVTLTRGVQCGDGTYVTRKQVVRRERISKEKVRNKYKEEFWLNYYAHIRNLENKNKLAPSKVEAISTQAILVYRNTSIQEATKYIYDQFKKYS
jgi:hypothetical protein